jgi:hypothetical protein
VFQIPRLELHEERLLELDVGALPQSVTVAVTFCPPSGVGPLSRDVAENAELFFYATNRPTERPSDYRLELHVRGRLPPTPDPAVVSAENDVLRLHSVRGNLYMALFAPQPLINVVVRCRIGIDPVAPTEDHFGSIWHIARQFNVDSLCRATVEEFFVTHRARLTLEGADFVLTEAGENPLHALMGACGDVELARYFCHSVGRFVDPKLPDRTRGETPLMRLLLRPERHDPSSPWYQRALRLAKLLVEEAAVPLDVQSAATGDCVMHIAARHHRRGGDILPLLLHAGGGRQNCMMRNAAGRTPMEEAAVVLPSDCARAPCDVEAAMRLLEAADPNVALPVRRFVPGADGLQRAAAGERAIKSLPAPTLVDLATSSVDDDAPQPRVNARRLHAEFAKIDTDGDGLISRMELRGVLERYDPMGVPLSASDIDRWVDHLGICDDGQATVDELALLLFKLQGST